MEKRPEIFFQRMLLAIQQIRLYTVGLDQNGFKSDQKTQDAVIRQLEILGEAAGRIPGELVTDSPIPWNLITGMRHKLIHNYLGGGLEIIWQTVSKALRPLEGYILSKTNG